ncbi:MAG: IS1634 family transposase [Verrucomicrobiales bacterium]|nr:IS1634 family transposase [Verrucomicrobiales bacterium]
MFLRRHRKHVRGETYEYWSLVKTIRTARGPRHQIVARLGKLDGAEITTARSWQDLDALLEGRQPNRQLELLSVGRQPPAACWREVDVSGVRVERLRQFGRVYLGLALWRRLGLHTLLKELFEPGQEEIGWEVLACVLSLGRFCAQPSELSLAERWYNDTALEDLLGVPLEKINESRLYRGLDALLPHKDALCQHLLGKYRDWFGVRYEFLLYDVTSTYFEGLAEKNKKAAHGYSRDKRPDCRQVCIGLVVTPEGLPVAYEVFAGNRNDVTTLEEIVRLMEEKYGQAGRVWVVDRGMVSEENLEWLRKRGATYLVGTPRSQLKAHEAALLEKAGWQEACPGLEVKLLTTDEGGEQFILCRSPDRKAKEAAMLQRQLDRLQSQLGKIHASLQAKPERDLEKVGRRIGRWQGKNPAAARVLSVTVEKNARGRARGLSITERTEKLEWARLIHGAYLLRTNHPGEDPAQLWRWYMQLTQAESAFRTGKSDLHLRPVFHQKTERVEAHILVSFLSLALWRVLEQWMRAKGLGDCARQLLLELDELRSLDVVLPVRTSEAAERTELRLRMVARPEPALAMLLERLGLELPQRPKFVERLKM